MTVFDLHISYAMLPIYHYQLSYSYLTYLSDVLKDGIWREFASDISVNHSDYLSNLALSLQGTVLASKACSTIDKYLGGWKRWKSFAHQFSFQVFPVKRANLALYIQHLLTSAASIAPIDTAIYSIRWAHTLAGISSPTDDNFIKSVVEGSRRTLAKPKTQKKKKKKKKKGAYFCRSSCKVSCR